MTSNIDHLKPFQSVNFFVTVVMGYKSEVEYGICRLMLHNPLSFILFGLVHKATLAPHF